MKKLLIIISILSGPIWTAAVEVDKDDCGRSLVHTSPLIEGESYHPVKVVVRPNPKNNSRVSFPDQIVAVLPKNWRNFVTPTNTNATEGESLLRIACRLPEKNIVLNAIEVDGVVHDIDYFRDGIISLADHKSFIEMGRYKRNANSATGIDNDLTVVLSLLLPK